MSRGRKRNCIQTFEIEAGFEVFTCGAGRAVASGWQCLFKQVQVVVHLDGGIVPQGKRLRSVLVPQLVN